MKPKPRKKWGTNVAQPKPFTVFAGKAGKVGVRIGTQRPFFCAEEVIVSAAPIRIAVDQERDEIVITGEGVVRRHRGTIAITS